MLKHKGIKREKRKKMVKVERVNFLGSEVWGLAGVGKKLGGWDDAGVVVLRCRGH